MKIVETLRGPASKFINEVRQELETGATKKIGPEGPETAKPLDKSSLATSAAEAIKEKPSVPPPELK